MDASPLTPRSSHMPYWRLSNFYLFYFASLGALLPYWSLYLKSLGFAPAAIGELMALIMATRIVAPNVWGYIADHMGRRMLIVRLGTLCAAAAFAGVFWGTHYWWLAGVMFVFSFFWNAALPQFEATTLSHLGEQVHRYSSIRLWGSVGFIIAVTGLGYAINDYGPAVLPAALMALIAGIWLASLWVPERAAQHLPLDHEPLRRVLRRPAVAALLVVCFLMQASHGPYYTFYTIYLEAHGYAPRLIGVLWALGVVAEVGVFVFMHRLVPRFGVRRLLLASLALATLRWVMIGTLVGSLPLLVAAQTLHAASFGVYHAAAIQLIHGYFTGRHQGKGQALYSSVSFGAGGAIGSYYSGLTWGTLGSTATYLIAAGISAFAFVVAWRFVGLRQVPA